MRIRTQNLMLVQHMAYWMSSPWLLREFFSAMKKNEITTFSEK
jgi:putative NADPH-quinone reductase